MYAKIENGRIVFPPRVLRGVERTFTVEDETITGLYNVGYDPAVEPEPEVVAYLTANGYLPVVTSQRPEDGEGYYYVDGYELGHDDTTDTDEIVQVWERREMPDPDEQEVSAEEALDIILGGGDHEA